MLAGVRTGKKKRKKPSPSSRVDGSCADGGIRTEGSAAAAAAEANAAAADELRRQLLMGGAPAPTARTRSSTSTTCSDNANDEVLARLEKQGKIQRESKQVQAPLPVVLTDAAASTLDRAQYRKEDFRHGSRKGKLSERERTQAQSSSAKEMTVADMVAEERREGRHQNMDETFARNVARIGSRYKGADFARGHGSGMGADEVDYHGIEGGADMSMFRDGADRLTEAARAQRAKSRQIAQHDRQQSVTTKCWWWMESSRFERHRLLALGNHVSMMLVPSNLALTPMSTYLVPIRHSESLVSCEDEVWDELQRFRTSLRAMFAKQDMGVLFCETVLPSSQLWQARCECIPVPKRVEQDAQMFFKSALTEQAEEWGTHTKLLLTRQKGLRRTVPRGFAYINIEWDGGGFAQIIESNDFPRDFALDTIAGMMQLDPVRFKRKQKVVDGNKDEVLEFCRRWKEFDWTLQLD